MEVVCSLNALIPNGKIQQILNRLSLLCKTTNNNTDDNDDHDDDVDKNETFFDHERVYSAATTTVSRGSSKAGANSPPFLLRLVYDLRDDSSSSSSSQSPHHYVNTDNNNNNNKSKWKLIHLGDPDASEARSTIVRPIVSTPLLGSESNGLNWVSSISPPFSFSFELVKKGFRFRWLNETVIAEIFQAFRVSNPFKSQQPLHKMHFG